MNYESVYRTAPATPGLLNILKKFYIGVNPLLCTGIIAFFVVVNHTFEKIYWSYFRFFVVAK